MLILIGSTDETANDNVMFWCQSEDNVFVNDYGADQSFCEDDVKLAPARLLRLSFINSSEGTYNVSIRLLKIIKVYSHVAIINSCMFSVFYCFICAVHSTNVSDVIQRKQSSINYKPKVKELIDTIPIIRQSGLARHLSWHVQVEKAVEGESDAFWQQVRK